MHEFLDTSMGIAIMSLATSLAHAKNIDYTPDLTSDTYWESHHICLVRVTAVERHEYDPTRQPFEYLKDQITFEVVKRFSEEPGERKRTAPLAHFWFGSDPLQRPRIDEREHLVVFYLKKGRSQIAVQRISAPEDSALVKTLSRIADLRANRGGPEALSEGVFSADPIVATYCLKQMLTRSVGDLNSDVARLRELRDNEAVDARVRLLASQLAVTSNAGAPDVDEDYRWVQTSLAGSKLKDPQQLRLFVRRLLEFENRRQGNVQFLTKLVRDSNSPDVIRLVALSEFSDARLLKSDRPDDLSDLLFDACTTLLKDRSAAVRTSAAHMLLHICNRIAGNAAPDVAARYLQRAAREIRAALAEETDELTKSRMERHLQFIEAGATPTKLIESGIIPDPGLNR